VQRVSKCMCGVDLGLSRFFILGGSELPGGGNGLGKVPLFKEKEKVGGETKRVNAFKGTNGKCNTASLGQKHDRRAYREEKISKNITGNER